MKLRYVSITGADDEVAIGDLDKVADAHPYVEWAILLMPERMGQKRFPSAGWIRNFADTYKGAHKAMHLCGSAFLGFVNNDPEILGLMRGFRRIQLNLEFGDVAGKYDLAQLLAQIKAHPEFEFVIQYTDKNRDLLPKLKDLPNHAVLFDQSAGRGVAPDSWPAPIAGHFCGYAGGINPDNVRGHLEKIARVASKTETWIDMESGVRTLDNFDLDKVVRVLEYAAPFVS